MSKFKELGRYKIEELLGSGAYADVYRALDIALDRTVALKVLKPALLADEDAFARFLQEAKTLANLMHPHIAWVWDLGEANGRYFIAMRYIEGAPLNEVLRERETLPWDEAYKYTKEIAAALTFAHQKNLIHRDVKPGNIMISKNEGAILTDFGMVKAMQSSGMSTRTGAIIGTPQYIPPEIWKGKAPTFATDQYALACIFIEMLTGQTVFDAPTPPAIMLKHFEPLELPSEWSNDTPDGIENVFRQALAQNPEERYSGVDEFLMAINSLSTAKEEKERAQQEFAEKRKREEEKLARQAELERVAREAAKKARKETEERLRQEMKQKPQSQERPAKKQSDEMVINLAPNVEMTFVRIPAGYFLMGNKKKKHDLEEYWISKYPVTNAQYNVFVTAGQEAPAHWKNNQIPQDKINHPVVNISWHDAQDFCKWASKIAGEEIRLPTEEEWEKAARGKDGRKYPWGENWKDGQYCNSTEAGIKGTTPVGQYPKGVSPYGVWDMSGNVWEWTASEGIWGTCVLRGGSWYNNGGSVRAAIRSGASPDNAHYSIGFRCARSEATP